MNIREMRALLGDTQSEFAARYNIPFRTIQNWESGVRTPPEYMMRLLEDRIRADLTNRKTGVRQDRAHHGAFCPAVQRGEVQVAGRLTGAGSGA